MKSRMLILAAVLLAAWGARASDTQRWQISTFDQWEKGKAQGVEIGSAGGLRPVMAVDSSTVDADGVWTMAAGAGGVYLGTGNSGKLLFESGGKVKEITKLSQVAITRIRMDRDGRPVFSAIPGGVIYRLNKDNQPERLAAAGEDYVWDFIFDGPDIIAATGPHGKIVRIGQDGKVKHVTETGEQNVMCLTRAPDGTLYAGTDGHGLVLALAPDGNYRVVHQFDEQEVRRLVWAGDAKTGMLLAAVNDEAGARPSAGHSASWARPPTDKEQQAADQDGDSQDDDKDDAAAAPMLPPTPAPRAGGKVTGTVYALTGSGGARELVKLSNRAAVDMVAAGPDVYVATDQEGKVYRLRPDSTDYAIAFDLPQAQALSLLADGKGLIRIGAGSPAAVARVVPRGIHQAAYLTDVLDASFPARWGAIEWTASGKVKLFTRSGNIDDPDRGWSDWREVGPGTPAPVKSPDARYLQVKVEWPAGSDAMLTSLTIPYRVYNQPEYVDKVAVDSSDQDGDKGPAQAIVVRAAGKNGAADTDPGPHLTLRKIAWKVTNPDKDDLEYHLFFSPENTKQWIPIKTDAPITKQKYDWETESLPDGWYRIKVVATDAPDNPPGEAIESSAVSDRFLIDNRPPLINGLAVFGGAVKGKAEDAVSAISGIEFSIDGGDWVTVAPEDGVFDSPDEAFKFDLPADLAPGLHLVSVRAWDRALNINAAQVQFEKK